MGRSCGPIRRGAGSAWWIEVERTSWQRPRSSVGEAGRAGRPGPDERSPRPSALKRGMPWPVRRNVRPACVSAGMRSITRPLSVSHRHLGAQERLAERHRQLALQVRAVPREHGWPARGPQVDVAGVGAAAGLAGEADPLPVATPARDLHLEAPVADLRPGGSAPWKASSRVRPRRRASRCCALDAGRPVGCRGGPRRGPRAWSQAEAGQDVVEVEARRRSAVRGGAARGRRPPADRRRRRPAAAEERPEEVAEAGHVLGVAAVLEADARRTAPAPPNRRRSPRTGRRTRRRPPPAGTAPSWRPAGRTLALLRDRPRTSWASLISLKRASAAASPLLTVRVVLARASLRKAFLMSAWLACAGRRGWRSSRGIPSAVPSGGRAALHGRPRAGLDRRTARDVRTRRTAAAGIRVVVGLRSAGCGSGAWLGSGRRLAPEGRLEDLVHGVDEDELDLLADLLRDVPQVLLVLARAG